MGREFEQLFNEWASTYDQTVMGNDIEYKEVFRKYDDILDEVATKAIGSVLEFGVGTGNLTRRIIDKGHTIYGIDPSEEMRKIATSKIPDLNVMDGDFLSFPKINEPIQTIVSSYAFHHLTDSEKEEAIAIYSNMLNTGDKIVFADSIFENEKALLEMIEKAKSRRHLNLLQDLETEYYSTIPVLKKMFSDNRFEVSFKQMNDFVWIIEAVKIIKGSG